MRIWANFIGRFLEYRNILDGSQVRLDDDGVDLAASVARLTKQFRCYRVPLLQHRLQDSALIGSVGDDMNEHGGLFYRPFGKMLFRRRLKSGAFIG